MTVSFYGHTIPIHDPFRCASLKTGRILIRRHTILSYNIAIFIKNMEHVTEELLHEIFIDIIAADERRAMTKTRNRYTRCPDLWESPWGLMYNNDEALDPTSHYGLKFRGKFRVPLIFLKEILLPLCIEHNLARPLGSKSWWR
jgi:hypothetical protein